jgi:hypothetical protein
VPSSAWLLLFWVATFGAWLFVHVVALARVLRSPDLGRRMKVASLFPLVTPWAAWRCGARVVAVLWAALAVLYVVLRLMD